MRHFPCSWCVLLIFLLSGISYSDEIRFGSETRFTDGSWMMLLGDSFANDGNADWAGKVRDLPPLEMAFFSEAGCRLNTMDSLFSDQLQTASQTVDIEAVVIAGGVNDIVGGRTLAQMQQSITSIIGKAGNRHIILTSTPPFRGRASIWNAARQQQADDYDAWLDSLDAGSDSISLFDIGAVLDRDGNQIIDPLFASGDNFHPQNCPFGQTCGMSVIADEFIQQFSASAVPEPGSSWLGMCAILWVFSSRRRK